MCRFGEEESTYGQSDCGCVGADNSGDDCDDCNGDSYGSAVVDMCGDCTGGNTDLEACALD